MVFPWFSHGFSGQEAGRVPGHEAFHALVEDLPRGVQLEDAWSWAVPEKTGS